MQRSSEALSEVLAVALINLRGARGTQKQALDGIESGSAARRTHLSTPQEPSPGGLDTDRPHVKIRSYSSHVATLPPPRISLCRAQRRRCATIASRERPT